MRSAKARANACKPAFGVGRPSGVPACLAAGIFHQSLVFLDCLPVHWHKNPDFRIGRTWWRYLAAAILFMALEPVLWGYAAPNRALSDVSGDLCPEPSEPSGQRQGG